MSAQLQIAVICTANACRSPVVEQLVSHQLAAHGIPSDVRSAGTHGGRVPVHKHTMAAAAEHGIDLTFHKSRLATSEILDDDGADLVITMTREHTAAITALLPDAARRTFTLPELARLAQLHGVDPLTRQPGEWIAVLDEARHRTADSSSEADDIADPYGGPRHGHGAMIEHTDRLVRAWVPLLAASIDVGWPS